MAIGNLVPWRWGTLRSFDDDRPIGSFQREMDSLHRSIDRLFADAWGGSFAPSLLSETWSTTRITPCTTSDAPIGIPRRATTEARPSHADC